MNNGDQFGRTPLIYCVLADRVDCAEALLKAGCVIDQPDETGRTALLWAAHKVTYNVYKHNIFNRRVEFQYGQQ